MKVPEEVRKVPRPANSVVIDKGPGSEPYRYIVQYRAANKTAELKRNYLLGYIIDLKFVPFVPIEFSFSFGGGAFAHSVSGDILADLCGAFGERGGNFIYVLGLIRAVKPYLGGGRIAPFYANSYIGKIISGMDLSAGNIDEYLSGISEKDTERYFSMRKGGNGSSSAVSEVYRSIFEFYPLLSEDAKSSDEILEFVNSIAIGIASAMYARAEGCGLLNEYTFAELLDLLNSCCKDYKASGSDMMRDSNWSWLPTDGVSCINELGFMEEINKKRRRVPWRKNAAKGQD